MDLFVDVEPFLQEVTLSPATVEKLLSVIRNAKEKKLLQVELAATIDAGLPFVKCTYNLEGDGPLVLSCYDTISALNMAARQAHYPNLDAIAGSIAANAHEESDLVEHAKCCVQPGIAYYFHQVSTNMKPALEAFKAARLFSPFRLNEIKPSVASLDTLSAFPFLQSEIPTLKQELPLYQAAAQDVDCSHDPLLFWKNHETELPTWAKAARQVLLVQPSSAASESIFAFEEFFWRKAECFLTRLYRDLIVMFQYNNR